MIEKKVNMNKGVCPVCNGSGRMSTPDNLRGYAEKYGWYGYSKEDDCCSCTNCGAQTMNGRATGEVNLREDGSPCKHEYSSETIGRCLTRYSCRHCVFSFQIDSGD